MLHGLQTRCLEAPSHGRKASPGLGGLDAAPSMDRLTEPVIQPSVEVQSYEFPVTVLQLSAALAAAAARAKRRARIAK
jgi:hypothetical protein